MVKFFGLLFAVAGLAMQANAALLVKYDFTGATAADRAKATTVGAGIVASDFAGAGNTTTSGFWTGTTNLNTNDVAQGSFTLETTSATGLEVTKIVYRFRASTTPSASRTQTASLTLSSGENLQGIQALTSSSNPFVEPVLELDPPLSYTPISELGPLSFNFTSKISSNSNTNGAKFQLDYVEVYGSVVPEPASMAVFGMLAVPVALRRLRRKS
jgi:hypothetical protein